jgi:hypothetical protein
LNLNNVPAVTSVKRYELQLLACNALLYTASLLF